MFRRLIQPALFASVQKRSAETPGALAFAFFTPFRTISPMLGAGIEAGFARAEQGAEAFQPRVMQQVPLGQTFGSPTSRGLVDRFYVLTRGKGL